MAEVSRYRTIAASAVRETEVRRSRFVCAVHRVASEDEAADVLAGIRKARWDARHHCSAWVLGPDGAVARSHDDGEPSGTAGAPMLQVLRGREVLDVLAVVSRYFGGVLLGAGGLVRAYSDAVGAALDASGVLERELVQRYEVTVSHAEVGRLENDLRARGVSVLGAEYGADRAALRLAVPVGEEAELTRLLAELTGGTARTVPAGQEWVDAHPSG